MEYPSCQHIEQYLVPGKRCHLVGIGGVSMRPLGLVLRRMGMEISGSDMNASVSTDELISKGIQVSIGHRAENIEGVDCLIRTAAAHNDNPEIAAARAKGIPIFERAQAWGYIMRAYKNAICVSGTHGKTTTSTMCAHIMHQSHVDCNAFLGGISKNYSSNYILSKESDFVVIEADEFDRSFHWLRPWMSVITSTDPDHLDIYGTKEAYLESFAHYSSLIQPGGALIIHKGLEMKAQVQPGVKVYEYSLDSGDFHAENIVIENGNISFDFISPIETVRGVQLGQPVPINIENGIAAMAMAQLNGCSSEELKYGMKTYRGVDRRFDFKLKNDKIVFLSDYAHHPKEIYQSARSIRELYRDKKITVIFQPHLYTRTRDFYKDFADSLSMLDEVVLCDIYPAREEPIPGVTSQLIYDNLKEGVEKKMIHKEDVLSFVKDNDFEVLVVLGAGDLDNYVPQIEKILQDKYK